VVQPLHREAKTFLQVSWMRLLKKIKAPKKTVFEEVRIYDAEGKLKRKISPKALVKRHWKLFNPRQGNMLNRQQRKVLGIDDNSFDYRTR
jgi:hypothetical protein